MINSARLLMLVSVLSGLGALSAPFSPLPSILRGQIGIDDIPIPIRPTTSGSVRPKATPTVHLGHGFGFPGEGFGPIIIPQPSTTDSSSSDAAPTDFVTVDPTVTESAAPSADTASSDAATTDVAVPNATKVANPSLRGPGLVIPHIPDLTETNL
ncbi:hypothetical protein BD410DRAFT_386018 [Rickenella mellea]|uniref:Uncharacterized protein n=1 Tax=Rickenella mellea TaxID=50990 RepID=A0A4Y7PZ71_9AGAM|nr:hypothetical protein BD410DRAFT_386018 [Rickenella mellea]